MKLSSDASMLATLSGGHTISLWNTKKHFEPLVQFAVPGSIRDYALAPDLSTIAILTADEQPNKECATTSRLLLYDTASKAFRAERPLLDVRCLGFLSPNSLAMGRLARGSRDDQVDYLDFVDLSSSNPSTSIPLPKHEMAVNLEILSRLNLLISLGIGLTVWDISTKALLQHIHCDNLQVSWDIWEATCCTALWQHNQVAIGFCSFSIGLTGYKICLFDVSSWNSPKWFMNDQLYPTSLALSSDGKRLAATLSDGRSARVWDTQNGALLGECIADNMTAVAFSPGNQFLITGANPPQALSLWKL